MQSKTVGGFQSEMCLGNCQNVHETWLWNNGYLLIRDGHLPSVRTYCMMVQKNLAFNSKMVTRTGWALFQVWKSNFQEYLRSDFSISILTNQIFDKKVKYFSIPCWNRARQATKYHSTAVAGAACLDSGITANSPKKTVIGIDIQFYTRQIMLY